MSKSNQRHVGTVHQDAAFDDEEYAAFLLGVRVECRSSWVEAARWDEEHATLTLWAGGKPYDFPGIDFDAAHDFAKAYSKGSWYWIEWRGHYGQNVPAVLIPLPSRPGKPKKAHVHYDRGT